MGESVEHEHRWLRYQDEATGKWNHWCIDGDTGHHPEPCPDAESGTGDHEGETTTVDDMDIHRDIQFG